MTTDEIYRSNVQALWNHLPDQPYNWRSISSVIGRPPRHVSPLDVPEGWVAPMLRRQILPFAEAVSTIPGSGPEVDVIDQRQFSIVKAEDLQAARFPNSFLCHACGLFQTVNPSDAAPSCPTHGQMEQLRWAEIHNCGHLAELRTPACGNGCGRAMRLRNTHRFQTSAWYWECSRCNTRSTVPVTRQCPTCRNGRATVSRIPQTSAYYAQQITVLNPPTRDTYAALAHEHVNAAAVAQMIGALPEGVEQLKLAGQTPEDSVAAFKQIAAQFGWNEGEALYEMNLAHVLSKAGTGPEWRTAVDALGLDPEQLDALGEECRQLSLVKDAGPLTVADLLTQASGSALEPTYHQYTALFDAYGMSSVTLLRELPVAFIVAGYTRGSDHAISVRPNGDTVATKFKFFPALPSGRFPMYGVRTETEGILIELDLVKVVSWLVDSGVVADPGVSAAHDARRWLFRVTDPVASPFNAPENRISEAVLTLTHSISHRMMKSVASRCGLNVDSLAEYLFPSNAAFLIYANTRSEFILGGLEHVFRYDLADAFDELTAETRCVFDPPCRHVGGGACAACLYVFEAACCRFNSVLDRNRLFGSLPDPATSTAAGTASGGGVLWQPFWKL